MKLAAVLLILCCLLGAKFAAAAQGPVCPPYSSRGIVLDFKTQMPRPTYNNSLSVAGIRTLFRGRGHSTDGPHSRAVGITSIETILALEASSTLVPQKQGGYCVYLSSVRADFGWQRMEVYVASELKPGGCAYNAVLDHENQHVSINSDSVRQFAPRIRAKLEALLRAQKPVFTREAGTTTEAILDQIKNQTSTVMNEFTDTTAKRQAVIDTASNYSATSQLCPDWGGTQKKG